MSLPRNCLCKCARYKDISENEKLKDILPVGYEYNACLFEETENGFATKIRINISTKEDALKWLDEFSYSSNTTFRVDRVFPENSTGNVYKVSKYCHHKCRQRPGETSGRKSKNTDCSARLIFTVKQDPLTKNHKSADVHLKEFPAIIVLYHTHNHVINAADALKYRPPRDDIKEKYVKMFQSGLTPSRAYHVHNAELQELYKENFFVVSADGAHNPNMKWVYYFYYQIFQKEYGNYSGADLMESLNSFALKFNQEQGGNFIAFKKTEDDNFIVVAVTPLMHRILSCIPQASEVLFCDATASVDRFGTKTFLLFTNSCCGGLPVCTILTSSEKEKELTLALQTFKDMLNNDSFGGRGQLGPVIIMTDDDSAERNSFMKIFPNAIVLLCTFHILQACWRYLCCSDNGVNKENRQEIFFHVKKMLYLQSAEEFEETFSTVMKIPCIANNAKMSKYLLTLFNRRNEWALFSRKNLITRGQNTNNICEAGVRVLKERILDRKKAYTPTQLLDFLVSDLNNFYIRKISNIANGIPPPYLEKKNKLSEEILNALVVEKISSDSYKVMNKNNKNIHFVDTLIGVCDCYQGSSGAVCKHQIKINKDLKINLELLIPKSAEEKEKLLFVSTGAKNVPHNWFSPLGGECSQMPSKNDDANDLEAKHDQLLPSKNDDANDLEAKHDQILPLKINDDVEDEGSEPNQIQMEASHEIHEKLKQDLESSFGKLLEKAHNNPALQNALGKFINNLNSIKTEQALTSALITFGKCPALRAKRKIVPSKYIGVQPTAIARRKAPCGGRTALQSGRPPKSSYVHEHAYNKSSGKSTFMPKKRIKIAAPHDLSTCVAANRSLGKKH